MAENKYLASSDISVFPTLNRTTETVFGRSQRLLTELNIANILRRSGSKVGYILACGNHSIGDGTNPLTLQFVFLGYFIEAKVESILNEFDIESGDTINVYVRMQSDGGALSGDSDDNKYQGVYFFTTEDTQDIKNSFLIGTISNSKNVKKFVPDKSSMYIYNGARVDASTIESENLRIIDGGTI